MIQLRRIFAVSAFLVGLGGLAGTGWTHSVVVISADTLTSTARTINGAKAVIFADQPDATVSELVLDINPQHRQFQLDSIRLLKPDILLTIGSAATRIARDNFLNTPIVFSSVMYPVISGFVKSMNTPGGHVTGASLTIAADVQFKYFRRIVPKLKYLGVLYSDNTASLIPPAKVIAGELGIKLVALRVGNDKELPAALDSLVNRCDGLWSIADPNLFSPQSTSYILLHAIRSGKPFMGFSRNVVESGALFALDFDYKAIGRQAGNMVNQIAKGARPAEIPVSTPDVIWFHYNELTAKHLRISIPADLVAVAKEVYR
ncbi:MAG: ABC transporter substrate-binding protein [candidate division Zixibacteria bacterium]|nr:ABC transporter substrate-binding protein [candidate division Zixibacteria bacterium]